RARDPSLAARPPGGRAHRSRARPAPRKAGGPVGGGGSATRGARGGPRRAPLGAGARWSAELRASLDRLGAAPRGERPADERGRPARAERRSALTAPIRALVWPRV